MIFTISRFKRILVWFWTAWWLIAFITDFIGGLKAIGLITASWFKVTNYPFMLQTLAPYDPPAWLPPLLYAGIILWLLIATVLFFAAAVTPAQDKEKWIRRVNSAFVVSLGLWLAFFIADQIVLNFSLEQNHMVQGGFQLLTFLAIHLLPDEK